MGTTPNQTNNPNHQLDSLTKRGTKEASFARPGVHPCMFHLVRQAGNDKWKEPRLWSPNKGSHPLDALGSFHFSSFLIP